MTIYSGYVVYSNRLVTYCTISNDYTFYSVNRIWVLTHFPN